MAIIAYQNTSPETGDSQPTLLGKILTKITGTGAGTDSTPLLAAISNKVALESTLVGVAKEATLSTRASEATLATRASETTLATRASETTLATVAKETTLATVAKETTLATVAKETTLASVLAGQTSGDQLVKLTDLDGHFAGIDLNGSVFTSNIPFDFRIAERNFFQDRAARIFNIFGSRSGFTSTSILNDVASFLPSQAGGAAPRYTDLTGVESLEVVSSSAADANPAGTGIRQVHVTYMDTNGDMVMSANVNLNGVTPVALPFAAKFIYWIEAATVGSGTVAAGNIEVRQVATGVIFDRIDVGVNRSTSCHFRVPVGYTGFVNQWNASALGGADQRVFLRVASHLFDNAVHPGVFSFRDTVIVSNATIMSRRVSWYVVPEDTEVKVSTFSSATGAANRVDINFEVIIIENP